MNDKVTPLISINEYGQIYLHLREIMDERGLSRNYLARITNTRFEVIDKWYHNQVGKLNLDVLARLCYVLKCAPGDLLEYRMEK